MVDFIHEIRERRILPAVGVYAAGCWVLIEILDRLVERYLLSPLITDIAFWGLYSLIPAVVLVAWSHGRPGRDKSTTAEKVGVPINIIASLGLLITIFGGKDLGATANMVTVANEEGVQETHYIPSESYRRRMAVFFFDNVSGDSQLDWLQYGITELLVQDLRQNPFVLANSPWSNEQDGFYSRMRQAGFMDGLGVPRSLMREIADDANRQYFIEGSIDRKADEYRVTARIWQTQSLKQIAEVTESGSDLYDTMDLLSREIRVALDVPQVSGRIAEDLPLAETYGESLNALKSYVAGHNARLFENDIEASNALLEAALEEDPGFVLAWFSKAINHLQAGDLPSSQVAIDEAQLLDYRLPARDRAQLKYIKYRLSGQNEKMIAFLRMQVRLRGDAESHNTLAYMLMATGALEEAKKEYLAALDKDPLNLDIYLQLSHLERATGDRNAAIAYAERYQAEKPEDIQAHIILGDYLRDNGEFDAAEEYYTQASLLENQPVQPMLRMADLAARNGDSREARRILEQAEEISQTPEDKGLVRQAAANLEIRLGRLYASIEQLNRQEEFLRQTLPPFELALATNIPKIQNYAHLGDIENAEAALAQAATLLQPPLDKFLAFSKGLLLLEKNDIEGARQALGEAEELIAQFRLEVLKSQVDFLNGLMFRKQGDHQAAAASFRAAQEKIEGSVIAGTSSYSLLPILIAELAKSQVMSGDLDGAKGSLARGFRLDPSQPLLWVSKAQLQLASDLPQLAQASVGYALAIWKDADPEYMEYQRALALAAEIRQVL
jgi:tetratricopeptide (TPR) repeat protein